MKQVKTRLIAAALTAGFATTGARADEAVLRTAISFDGPPYVMDHAAAGLEVEIVRRALPGHDVQYVQMPFGQTRAALEDGSVDAAVSVGATDDGFFYSDNYIAYSNDAISRKDDAFEINGIDDLVGHRLLAWTGAYRELGPAFEKLFAPGAPDHDDYVEIQRASDQVGSFWKTDGAVAIINVVIFDYFSGRLGHSMDEVVLHPIFPPKTAFRVGFKDAGTRDAFNRGLAELCRSGEYAALLKQYDIDPETSVCN